jgi:hypothetical protein
MAKQRFSEKPISHLLDRVTILGFFLSFLLPKTLIFGFAKGHDIEISIFFLSQHTSRKKVVEDFFSLSVWRGFSLSGFMVGNCRIGRRRCQFDKRRKISSGTRTISSRLLKMGAMHCCQTVCVVFLCVPPNSHSSSRCRFLLPHSTKRAYTCKLV